MHINFFRWAIILWIALGLLLLVIIIHTMVEKVMKNFHNAAIEDMGNQEIGEPLEHLFDSTSIVLLVIILFSSYALRFLPNQILNLRFSLLLLDSIPIVRDFVFMSHMYYRNPHLRAYVWKNMISTSSVQPQHDQNEIELQSM